MKKFEVEIQSWNWDGEEYTQVPEWDSRFFRAESIELAKQLVDELIKNDEFPEEEFEPWDSNQYGNWICARERPDGDKPKVTRYSIREVGWNQTKIPGLEELTPSEG